MADRNSLISNLATVISLGLESYVKDLHTALPGIIESFNSIDQTVSVQPAIKRVFKTDDGDKEILIPQNLPLLINVPVIYPRGGGFSLTFPVKQNDECLIIFCERAIDDWHKKGGINKPANKRFHSFSDAVALIGLSSIPNNVPNYNTNHVELKKDDNSVNIVLRNDGNVEVNASIKVTINAPESQITGNLDVDGNLNVDGNSTMMGTLDVTGDTTLSDVTSNGNDIGDTHTHGGVTPGLGNTGPTN